MADVQDDLARLGRHLAARRGDILKVWQTAIQRDPEITSGDALPRAQLLDHIPGILEAFERVLTEPAAAEVRAGAQAPAAAHGLQRWRQGYDLREVTRELGKLNECLVAEMDGFAAVDGHVSPLAMAVARRLWASISGAGIEESVAQYFDLQKREALGEMHELERAIEGLKSLEVQRADLWRQAAHDLRGNLGVVANATAGLAEPRETGREEFVRILMRNVRSLQHLLDDVTSLARLQAGREVRHIEPVNIGVLLQSLCEDIRPLAQQRRLFLRSEGPSELAVEGDGIKIRRIAQNLILNAVKFTEQGGITVRWGEGDRTDPKHWVLTVEDTGPGLPAASPIAQALEAKPYPAAEQPAPAVSPPGEGGEGIGLSIVKRLCEMLDAGIESAAVATGGTRFRVQFPRRYGV
ncbi:MAG TPA: HAMP domain-containing sensor histidine kinase [Steroidobacteraceae bacterium]|nr:HAMP domain-containing sensor histidine kinase [Steroidobacteraceae bacterium]